MVTFEDVESFKEQKDRTKLNAEKYSVQMEVENAIMEQVFGQFLRSIISFGWGQTILQINVPACDSTHIQKLVNDFKAKNVVIRPIDERHVMLEVYYR